jgi:hypothetical protein
MTPISISATGWLKSSVRAAADVDRYWHVMNRLAIEAAPAPATTEIIHQIRTGTAP